MLPSSRICRQGFDAVSLKPHLTQWQVTLCTCDTDAGLMRSTHDALHPGGVGWTVDGTVASLANLLFACTCKRDFMFRYVRLTNLVPRACWMERHIMSSKCSFAWFCFSLQTLLRKRVSTVFWDIGQEGYGDGDGFLFMEVERCTSDSEADGSEQKAWNVFCSYYLGFQSLFAMQCRCNLVAPSSSPCAPLRLT